MTNCGPATAGAAAAAALDPDDDAEPVLADWSGLCAPSMMSFTEPSTKVTGESRGLFVNCNCRCTWLATSDRVLSSMPRLTSKLMNPPVPAAPSYSISCNCGSETLVVLS